MTSPPPPSSNNGNDSSTDLVAAWVDFENLLGKNHINQNISAAYESAGRGTRRLGRSIGRSVRNFFGGGGGGGGGLISTGWAAPYAPQSPQSSPQPASSSAAGSSGVAAYAGAASSFVMPTSHNSLVTSSNPNADATQTQAYQRLSAINWVAAGTSLTGYFGGMTMAASGLGEMLAVTVVGSAALVPAGTALAVFGLYNAANAGIGLINAIGGRNIPGVAESLLGLMGAEQTGAAIDQLFTVKGAVDELRNPGTTALASIYDAFSTFKDKNGN